MWKDLESLSGVNRSNIFSGVYYTNTVNQLSYAERDCLFATTKQSLDDLANIKNNPSYCQFVSEHVGYDLFHGFYNLRKSQLIISSEKSRLGPHLTTIGWKNGGYSSELNFPPVDIRNTITPHKRSIIGHELGHSLIFASKNTYDTSQIVDLKNNIKDDADLELACDAISIASNLENDIGLSLAHKHSGYLNMLYQKNILPKKLAYLLSDFVELRSELINNSLDKIALKSPQIAQDIYNFMKLEMDIHLSDKYPSDLTRAVKGDQFATKAHNFIKNTPS